MSKFTCYNCNETFSKMDDQDWNECKATEEFLSLHPECKNDPVVVLCGYCDDEFKKWFSVLSEKEKKKMRDDFYKEQKSNE